MFAFMGNDRDLQQGEHRVCLFTHIEQDTPRPDASDRYGQNIEPMGLWVTMGHHGTDGLTDGRATFRHLTAAIKPLIVKAIATGEHNAVKAWKVALSERYNGATGVALTRAVMNDGYTAIVTVDEHHEPGEIVLLNAASRKLCRSHL